MRLPAVKILCSLGLYFLGSAASARAADDIAAQIDIAHQAYVKGDALHALSTLQLALTNLNGKLTEQFGKQMPPPPVGWEAGAAESQSLDGIGGGLTVVRGYSKGSVSLNAELIVDNPAVFASAALFQNNSAVAGQPGWSRLRLGSEEALLRFDAASRTGEVLMVLGDRVLLQVEGNEITATDPLLEIAKGWNIPAIRKLLTP